MPKDLFDTAFTLNEDQTNGHWKHEQDNYLSQIGAMDLIKRDPMASLGYQIRSANPERTLEMGSNLDPSKFYGLYKYRPTNSSGRRYDGTVDVSVEVPQDRYGQVLAHELGHVGSRNSQSDSKLDGASEERRQRLVDFVNTPPGSPMHRDAVAFLMTTYGLDSYDKLQAAANVERKKLGMPLVPLGKKTKKVATK